MKAVRWRLAFSLVVFLAALWYALPNLPQVGQGPLARFFPQARINLGLDLKGGMNLTLGVDVEKAIQNTLASSGQDMRERALEDKISLLKPRLNAEGLLEVVLPPLRICCVNTIPTLPCSLLPQEISGGLM